MQTVLAILLPIPAAALSPNARRLWHKKCGPVREARQFAKLAAMDAMNRMQMYDAPKWARAETVTRFYYPTKRRRDADNSAASMKAYFDGFADAGVVKNDTGFVHQPPTIAVDKENPRVEVEIRELS